MLELVTPIPFDQLIDALAAMGRSKVKGDDQLLPGVGAEFGELVEEGVRLHASDSTDGRVIDLTDSNKSA